MPNALNHNLFFVREHMALMKATKNYEFLDPESGTVLMRCAEEHIGRLAKLLRFSDLGRTTPFDICVRDIEGRQVLRIVRGIPILASRVRVLDESDIPIGEFRQKAISISGTFDVLNAEGKAVCRLKGMPTGWEYRFETPDGVDLARVTKKWAGLGKELFTGADDYMLQVDEAVPRDSTLRQLILASVLCVDLVCK